MDLCVRRSNRQTILKPIDRTKPHDKASFGEHRIS